MQNMKQTTENKLLNAALYYAAQGLAVFPLQPKGKTPITNNGFKAATTDPAIIKNWWREYPAANIGIATGQRSGGLVVVDLDNHITENGEIIEGYDSLREWQRQNGQLPDTAGTITGSGGNHWLFKLNKTTGNRAGLLPAVDVRADGGYIVAPPSIHPNGNAYEWEQTIKDYGIADGGEILEKLLNEGAKAQALSIPDIIPEGQRNDILFKIACSLQAKGLTDRAIYNAVKAENMERCRPQPLTDREIEALIKSALKYEKGKPQQKADTQQPQAEHKTPETEQGDDLALFLDKIQTETYKPHATGVTFLDALLNGGVENQTINLIAAAPATGKTALCSQIAEAIARNGRPVIYLNFEMSREQMLSRVISARLLKRSGYKMTAKQIRQGFKWNDTDREKITAEVEAYRQESRPRYIDSNELTPELKNITEFLEQCGHAAITKGEQAPAVFVDYLHLITSKGNDLPQTIKDTCTALKAYATKYNSFVFAILAVNRDSLKDGRPTLFSARDSSNIEYSADAFITLNFKAYDSGDIKPHDLEAMENYKRFNNNWEMILRSLKDRSDGQAPAQTVLFNPASMTFYATANATNML